VEYCNDIVYYKKYADGKGYFQCIERAFVSISFADDIRISDLKLRRMQNVTIKRGYKDAKAVRGSLGKPIAAAIWDAKVIVRVDLSRKSAIYY